MGREFRAYTLVILGIVCGLVWGQACSSGSSSNAAPMQQASGWEIIETITVPSDTPMVEFTGIPSGYRYLKAIMNLRHDAAGSEAYAMSFNDTPAGVAGVSMIYQDSTLTPGTQTGLILGSSHPADQEGMVEILISNDPAQDKMVSVRSENFTIGNVGSFLSGTWQNTSEINKITIQPTGGANIRSGSFLVLLGLN